MIFLIIFTLFSIFRLKKPVNKGKSGIPLFKLIPDSHAGGGTRTHTPSRTTDFESVSSANSDTPADLLSPADLIICNKTIIVGRNPFVNIKFALVQCGIV